MSSFFSFFSTVEINHISDGVTRVLVKNAAQIGVGLVIWIKGNTCKGFFVCCQDSISTLIFQERNNTLNPFSLEELSQIGRTHFAAVCEALLLHEYNQHKASLMPVDLKKTIISGGGDDDDQIVVLAEGFAKNAPMADKLVEETIADRTKRRRIKQL